MRRRLAEGWVPGVRTRPGPRAPPSCQFPATKLRQCACPTGMCTDCALTSKPPHLLPGAVEGAARSAAAPRPRRRFKRPSASSPAFMCKTIPKDLKSLASIQSARMQRKTLLSVNLVPGHAALITTGYLHHDALAEGLLAVRTYTLFLSGDIRVLETSLSLSDSYLLGW